MAEIKHKEVILKDGNAITIRNTEKSDAANILDYMNIIGGESDNLTFSKDSLKITVKQEEKFIESIRSESYSILLVGYIKGEIVSTASITSQTKARISHSCEIAVSVKKKFWGIGIGTAVMSTLIEFAKKTNKIEIIHLEVRADNKNAIHLYHKLGFEEIGLYKKFFKIDDHYFDALLMNLYL